MLSPEPAQGPFAIKRRRGARPRLSFLALLGVTGGNGENGEAIAVKLERAWGENGCPYDQSKEEATETKEETERTLSVLSVISC
jgi:hypothetical protein